MSDKTNVFDLYAQTYNEELDHLLAVYGTNYHVFANKRGQVLKNLCVRDFGPEVHPEILDFGCGIGGMIPIIRGLFKKCAYVGFEPSKKSLQIAKKYFEAEGCSFFSDIRCIDKKFMLIIASGVLHHIVSEAERLNILRLLFSKLQEKGCLVIFEHNPYNPLTRRIVRDCVYDKDAELISQRRLVSLVLKGGGQVLKKGYYTFFPFHNPFSSWLEGLLKWLPFGAQHYMLCTRSK